MHAHPTIVFGRHWYALYLGAQHPNVSRVYWNTVTQILTSLTSDALSITAKSRLFLALTTSLIQLAIASVNVYSVFWSWITFFFHFLFLFLFCIRETLLPSCISNQPVVRTSLFRQEDEAAETSNLYKIARCLAEQMARIEQILSLKVQSKTNYKSTSIFL